MYLTGVQSAFSGDMLGNAFQVLEGYTQNNPYLGVFIILVLSIVMGTVMLSIGGLIRLDRPDPQKILPYECGLDPYGDAMEMVKPRYYVYAMLFLAFDIELLFMFPWAVIFKDMEKMGYGNVAFFEMIMFILILFVGLIYVWIKGALEWE